VDREELHLLGVEVEVEVEGVEAVTPRAGEKCVKKRSVCATVEPEGVR